MPANLLVAKRSYARAKTAVVKRTWTSVARGLKRINKPATRVKFSAERKNPRVTPAQRREQLQITAEVDNDVLTIDEKVELPNNNQRGHLLRQSTLKPSPSEKPSLPKPDNIPINGIDTVKRVIRIVANTPAKESPKEVSIGIQVGPPFKRQPPPVVVPSGEPPLRSYWTHKVNLPYPPAQAPVHQPQLIQQPIHFLHQPTHFQPPIHYPQPEHYYQEQLPILYPYPSIVQYQVQP
ncbi:uncharacterized protein LOC129569580 [Sitodiplosis mosellana]|uniref:uncharacterized protein LOC129569580 n=1 Tax=Sitodiplosis mosellana TaxID=263140 RepID=UPI0024440F0F|nr:uncharacterized protein LOC129569580 [Sitodiplosis mosellana]